MKKLFQLMLLLSVSLISFGQERSDTLKHIKLSLGLKGGLDYISINSSIKNTYDTLSGRPSFQLGLTSRLNFNKRISLSFEPGFIEKGALLKTFLLHENFKLGYINTPILFSYSLLHNLYGEVGPEVSYRVYAQTKGYYDSFLHDIINNNKAPVDISIILGLSYTYQKIFGVGLRCSYSITKMTAFTYKVDPMAGVVENDKEYNLHNMYCELFFRFYLFNIKR
jgi:Outer membrane protein beta-barrel domain